MPPAIEEVFSDSFEDLDVDLSASGDDVSEPPTPKRKKSSKTKAKPAKAPLRKQRRVIEVGKSAEAEGNGHPGQGSAVEHQTQGKRGHDKQRKRKRTREKKERKHKCKKRDNKEKHATKDKKQATDSQAAPAMHVLPELPESEEDDVDELFPDEPSPTERPLGFGDDAGDALEAWKAERQRVWGTTLTVDDELKKAAADEARQAEERMRAFLRGEAPDARLASLNRRFSELLAGIDAELAAFDDVFIFRDASPVVGQVDGKDKATDASCVTGADASVETGAVSGYLGERSRPLRTNDNGANATRAGSAATLADRERRKRQKFILIGNMARCALGTFSGEEVGNFVRALFIAALERRREAEQDARRKVTEQTQQARLPMLSPMEHLRQMAAARRAALVQDAHVAIEAVAVFEAGTALGTVESQPLETIPPLSEVGNAASGGGGDNGSGDMADIVSEAGGEGSTPMAQPLPRPSSKVSVTKAPGTSKVSAVATRAPSAKALFAKGPNLAADISGVAPSLPGPETMLVAKPAQARASVAKAPPAKAPASRLKPKPKPVLRKYYIDQSLLAATPGLRYYKSAVRSDLFDRQAEWGSVVVGEPTGDGERLRTEDGFLPLRLNTVPVVVPLESGQYKVDFSRLRTSAGLRYTTEKGRDDKESGSSPWGGFVEGFDQDDGYIKVGFRFLPKTLNGVHVVRNEADAPPLEQAAAPLGLETVGSGRSAGQSPAGVADAAPPTAAGVATKNEKRITDARLYEIAKEMQERRFVIGASGKINVGCLKWFAQEMLETARTAAQWETAWVQLCLPEEKRNSVASELVRVLLDLLVRAPGTRIEPITDALAYLSKGQRIKLSVLEGAIKKHFANTLRRCPSAWSLISGLLLSWFPRPKGHGWGWSRIGWSWSEWWKLCGRVIDLLPPAVAFDTLRVALVHMQDREGGLPLRQHELWTEERLAKLREKFGQLHVRGRTSEPHPADAPVDMDSVRAELRGLEI